MEARGARGSRTRKREERWEAAKAASDGELYHGGRRFSAPAFPSGGVGILVNTSEYY